jgi:hypothetical protein
MARQRFIWPDIWKDPVFGRLTAEEQVFFIACFSLADDEGRLLADTASLRGDMFRFKTHSLGRVKKVRDGVVAKVESVHLYTAQGQEYIALLKWGDYQRPKYPSPSKIPPPFLQSSPILPPVLEEDSSTGRDGLEGDELKKPSKLTPVEKVRNTTLEKFFAYSDKIGFQGRPRLEALDLLPAFLEDAMLAVRSRQDVNNPAAYMTTVTRNYLAKQRGGWKSDIPLEQRLADGVQRAGWELTDSELREELIAYGADDSMIARLLVKADEIRNEEAA